MDSDHAWFRAGAKEAWHEVTSREDTELVARCGSTHSWTRSQQVRSASAPEPSCEACAALRARLPERIAATLR
jgi:hypothetical protein